MSGFTDYIEQISENEWNHLLADIEKLDSGCWEWNGEIKYNDPVCHFVPDYYWYVSPTPVYRLTWYWKYRTWPIAYKQQIHHTCFNSKCVNPEHFQLKTPEEHNSEHNQPPNTPYRMSIVAASKAKLNAL